MRDFWRSAFARVWLPVLGAAAIVAYLDRGTDTGDLIYFVHKGEQLLSGSWADTFADPVLQSGPLQLTVVGAVQNFTALAFLIGVGTAALFLYVIGRLGVNDRIRLVVGLAALAAGLTHGAFVDGHPAQAFVPLLWILAALKAREDRVVAAGVLVGLSAGLELWGVLGAAVLLLAPRLRRTALAVVCAGAVVAAMLVPFVVAGEFRMFEHEWHVSTGTLMSLVVEPGTDFGWELRLVQSVFALGAGVAVAVARRRSLHAAWLTPLAVVVARLLLDPLSFGWYWLGAEALVLTGAALLLTELPTRFPATPLARAAAPQHRAAARPPARS